MPITPAAAFDLEPAVDCLGEAFAQDPITSFLLQSGPGYAARVRQFLALPMGARLALGMPVLVARSKAGIQGAAMGYTTARPAWPQASVPALWRPAEATWGTARCGACSCAMRRVMLARN